MKKAFLALVCVAMLLAPGCYTMTHTVGAGAKTGVENDKRQWFILYGLVPLGEVDSKDLAGGVTDYTATTEMSIVDILLNLITVWVTITSRTVTVER